MTNVLIKELGKVSTGNTPSKSNEDYYNSADIGFVKPDIISDSEITSIESTNEYISEEARSKARIVKENTVFVTCIGSIGKIGIVRGNELAFNQQINAIEPNEKVLPEYLAYCLLHNKKRLSDIANAPVVPIINKTQFENFTVNITDDKKEQQKTIDVLNKVRCLIDCRKQQLMDIDTLIKSRFVELFGNPIVNQMNWDRLSVTDVCDDIYGGGTPSKSHPEYFEGNIPWVSPKDMKSDIIIDSIDHITEVAVEKSSAKMVPANSVLMVIRSGILKHTLPVAINSVPVTVNQDMKVFIPSNRVTAQYLAYLFKMIESDVLSGVRSVTADNIDFNSFKKRSLPIPPIALQDQFTSFVQQVDKLKFTLEQVM